MHNMEGKKKQGSLTVVGTGMVKGAPDAASIDLEVRTEAMQAEKAQEENAVVMSRVIQSLLQLGIPRHQIQTTAYRMNPQYDYVDGEQVFRGYEVVHVVTVQINQLNQVGQVIETAVGQGVTRVSDIRFTVTNSDAYEARALQVALQDAQMKAQALAATMQVNLNAAPSQVRETSAVSPEPYQTYMAAEKSTAVPIEPGQIEFRASVTVTYDYN
ncbi:uncharacterized protein JNUCC1_02770 [Lentibacillus sp. JNUCC-1]|uniref:SIMPL domain-containing protein n=1 Tax=Lentibacillus sp. JNUCC-1 TaxID=2654513 RepID=UPI0012E7491B|nr:SIMPL domain-containing protein [Lentibacillus sp. JNUCC-1]MUV38898.1 uncharacterized protein [Lentibacillus sp. JNUCC-1]